MKKGDVGRRPPPSRRRFRRRNLDTMTIFHQTCPGDTIAIPVSALGLAVEDTVEALPWPYVHVVEAKVSMTAGIRRAKVLASRPRQ